MKPRQNPQVASTPPQAASAELALACILQGDIEQGFALYESSLEGDSLPTVPAGLHASMLEQAGRGQDAARLRKLAVSRGADLAVRAGSFLGADPAGAAEEYESLFARGLINSRMVHEYLKTLAKLGRVEELDRLLAIDQLLKLVMLDARVPGISDDTLACAIDRMLLDLEEQAERQEAVLSVRHMRNLRGLATLDDPAARALIAEISRQIGVYLQQWRASDHPFARFVPDTFAIKAWGLISRGEGYNIPHIHHQGWVTGVFYPRSVEGPGGELVIGPPKQAAGSAADWGQRRVRPEAGLLVLMPSFYLHWTVPLQRPGLRTSVAFDVPPSLPG